VLRPAVRIPATPLASKQRVKHTRGSVDPLAMERRVSDRVRRRVVCEIVCADQRLRGILIDVSRAGAFIQLASNLRIGDELELWFADENFAPQVSRARVVRKRISPGASASVVRSGVAIEWSDAPSFARLLAPNLRELVEVEIEFPFEEAPLAASGEVLAEAKRAQSEAAAALESAPCAEPGPLEAAPPSAERGEIVPVESARPIEQTIDLAPARVRADVVVLDEGELGGIVEIVHALGAASLRMRWGSQVEPVEWEAPPRLVIATARVAMAVPIAEAARGAGSLGIAVCDSEASTLRARLRRQGYEIVVQRGAHPATLRLLLGGLLFRHRERRSEQRRAFGAPVRMWRGWRAAQALLLEVTNSGGSLLAAEPLARGTRVSVRVPSKHAAGRALSLPAQVERSAATEDGVILSVRFCELSARKRARLAELVSQLEASGPVAHDAKTAAQFAPGRCAPRGERRLGSRLKLSQQALAIDDRTGIARQVLFGTDFSPGGMRVEPHPALQRGAQIRIALQPPGGAPPVMLRAEVTRDDGPRGLVLRFLALSPSTKLAIERILDAATEIERTRNARAAKGERVVLGTLIDGSPASG
jgi:hypothetical protein